MVLHIDSNAAYLVLPKSKSRIAGFYYLSDHLKKILTPKLNRVILVECKALYHIISLSVEVEIGGVFHNV